MAHDVFISHSVKDKTTADAVCALLESDGIRCWIAPRDVVPGMEWGECIIDAIEQTRIMVLVFSANANASPQIRREVERAVNHDVVILPIRIENVLPGRALEYFIGNVHWLDALTPPLEAHLKSLAGTIKILLARIGPRNDPFVVTAASGVAEETKPPQPAVESKRAPASAEANDSVLAEESALSPEPVEIGPIASLDASEALDARKSHESFSGAGTVFRSRWKIPVWAWGLIASALLLVVVEVHYSSNSGRTSPPPGGSAPRPEAPSGSPVPSRPNTVPTAPPPESIPPSSPAPSQPNPTPATPGSGASLASTMKFIQDTLNGVGKVSFVVFGRNTRNGSTFQNNYSEEIDNVAANPGQCIVHLRWTEWLNGSSDRNEGAEYSLRDVTSVTVEPMQQTITHDNALEGNPNMVALSSDPPVTDLSIHRVDGEANFFGFTTDANLANNVKEALDHAAKLCGGEK